MQAPSALSRENLKALDASDSSKNDAGLDRWLPMGRSNKRRRNTELARLLHPPASDSKSAGCSNATRGLTLPALRAIVCIDRVGDDVFVDIQCWRDGARTVLSPGDLHRTLDHWAAHWESGSGRLTKSSCARFEADLQRCEEHAASIQQFVDSLF